MFEINGIPYSLEQITAAAEQMGITIEEYKEKFNAVEVDINVEDKIEEEGKPQVTVEKRDCGCGDRRKGYGIAVGTWFIGISQA